MSAALLCVILAGGSWWDLKTGRIPNGWWLCGLAGFLVIESVRGSPGGVWGSAWGMAAFLGRVTAFTAVFFLLFLFRMMGAGDLKMMALIGGGLGFSEGILVIFYGLAVSAVWSLFSMLRRGIFVKRIRYFMTYVSRFLESGQIVPYYQKGRDGGEAAFCLAPFLWCGLLIWLAGRGGAGAV